MPVYVNKDSVDIRQKLGEIKSDAGMAGNSVLRAETPQEQQRLIGHGRRNLIVNGDMSVWQRGTSFTGANADQYYTADRFAVSFFDDVSTRSVSRSTTAPRGFAYSMELNSGLQQLYPSTTVELPASGNPGVFGMGKEFTFSMYSDSTNAPDAFFIFRNGCHLGTNQVVASELGQRMHCIEEDSGNGFKRYSYTFTIKDVPHADNICFTVAPRFYETSGTFRITGYQLEEGSTATSFEYKLAGEELALCQRYYHRITNNFAVNQNLCTGVVADSDDVFGVIDMPVTMRTAPSVLASAPASFRVTTVFGSGSSQNCSQLMLGYDGQTHVTIKARGNGGGFTAGQAKLIGFNETVGLAYIAFDAEIPSQ